jgi:hypothetical protein
VRDFVKHFKMLLKRKRRLFVKTVDGRTVDLEKLGVKPIPSRLLDNIIDTINEVAGRLLSNLDNLLDEPNITIDDLVVAVYKTIIEIAREHNCPIFQQLRRQPPVCIVLDYVDREFATRKNFAFTSTRLHYALGIRDAVLSAMTRSLHKILEDYLIRCLDAYELLGLPIPEITSCKEIGVVIIEETLEPVAVVIDEKSCTALYYGANG